MTENPIDPAAEAELLCIAAIMAHVDDDTLGDTRAVVAHVDRVRADFVARHGPGSAPAFERGQLAALRLLYAEAAPDEPPAPARHAMSAEIEAMLTRVWEACEALPAGDRVHAGGRLVRMAQELLGPVYWTITLEALARIDAEDRAAT